MIGNAVKVMRILTGEETEEFDTDDGKDKAAQSMGRRGGKARAEALVRHGAQRLRGLLPRSAGVARPRGDCPQWHQ
jgi:hypothetical protein